MSLNIRSKLNIYIFNANLRATEKKHMKNPCLISLFTLCALLFACNNPQREHKNNNAVVHAHIENNGVPISYTDSDIRDTTLLFVHGWCINKGYWADQVAHFDEKYRVVALICRVAVN
jgi:hypothetical protein